MTGAGGLAPRLLAALDRFHAARPWDHNAHYHRAILRRLPRRPGPVLDVGCGSGDLARLLARRASAVTAIDADPGIVARAREASPAAAVTFTVADALDREAAPGPYTAVTCVAVLHHLPLAEAFASFRARLAPGGVLVVVGLYRETTPADRAVSLLALLANTAIAWAKHPVAGTSPRPLAMTARTRPAQVGLAQIRRTVQEVLPGARVRRRLFWRYVLEWKRP
ncbi:class I SAM-dependent methyltransferase [Streptomyces sp. SPB074]|uniref:class I SAM-dependent methyltransferase n=1 Tax=Streptomyces sp. (strain SPB074) TaxID=465543 RepID=UPI00056991D0|nr:class I SAM-dependent methyltransferase [Streptomyces sp. SPB074]